MHVKNIDEVLYVITSVLVISMLVITLFDFQCRTTDEKINLNIIILNNFSSKTQLQASIYLGLCKIVFAFNVFAKYITQYSQNFFK